MFFSFLLLPIVSLQGTEEAGLQRDATIDNRQTKIDGEVTQIKTSEASQKKTDSRFIDERNPAIENQNKRFALFFGIFCCPCLCPCLTLYGIKSGLFDCCNKEDRATA